MSGDELVDVVDEQDRVVGQATRRDVRRKNLRHRSVYVLVFNPAGQLFVHQRTPTKDVFPNLWDVAVGGVPHAGEAPEDGARRELAEELGITGIALRRLFRMPYEDAANRVCGTVYSCTWNGALRLQASEIVTGEWMDLDLLLERTQHGNFCPDGLQVLHRYLSKLEAVRQRQ
jgi:isopentenyldiphosphate isomerase